MIYSCNTYQTTAITFYTIYLTSTQWLGLPLRNDKTINRGVRVDNLRGVGGWLWHNSNFFSSFLVPSFLKVIRQLTSYFDRTNAIPWFGPLFVEIYTISLEREREKKHGWFQVMSGQNRPYPEYYSGSFVILYFFHPIDCAIQYIIMVWLQHWLIKTHDGWMDEWQGGWINLRKLKVRCFILNMPQYKITVMIVTILL